MVAYWRLLDNADRSASSRSTSPAPDGAARDAFSLPLAERAAYLSALGHVVDGVQHHLSRTAA